MTFLELQYSVLTSPVYKFDLVVFRSPGVIITEIHKRGGMNDEEYAKVGVSELNVHFFHTLPPLGGGSLERRPRASGLVKIGSY